MSHFFPLKEQDNLARGARRACLEEKAKKRPGKFTFFFPRPWLLRLRRVLISYKAKVRRSTFF